VFIIILGIPFTAVHNFKGKDEINSQFRSHFTKNHSYHTDATSETLLQSKIALHSLFAK